MVDFPDGSYNMNPKFLSLVTSEEDAAADATSEHRQVGKRSKAREPSSEKPTVTVGTRFCDSDDDAEYEVTEVTGSSVQTVVLRTGKPHLDDARNTWDTTYAAQKGVKYVEDAAAEESEESEEQSQEEGDERSSFSDGEGEEEEGGEEEEHRHAREHAKAGAPSKGKKRAAPAGARTSKAAKAAKKKKNSASACQVRSERSTADANVARAGCQATQRGSQNLMRLHMIRTGGIVRGQGLGVYGGSKSFAFSKLEVGNQGKSEQS